jgi:hypothetical protein
MTPSMATLHSVVTWIVTSIFGAGLLLALTENIKELLKQRGANTLLVRSLDALPKQLHWERLRGLWWLWAIFGLSGGVALALWLSPFLVGQPSVPPVPVVAKPNPLHDAAPKWRLAQSLNDLSSKMPAKCDVVIVRYQMPYSETYSDDIKEVLTTIDWKFREAFATEELPRGLSLKGFETGLSRTCLDALKQRFDNDLEPSPYVPAIWIKTATKYMSECSGQCVEIDIGNAP